jgi:hypothetical protein
MNAFNVDEMIPAACIESVIFQTVAHHSAIMSRALESLVFQPAQRLLLIFRI